MNTEDTSLPGSVPVERYPRSDADVPGFLASLDIPGIVDIHVHVLPERLQAAVWRYFDALEAPPWPIRYREPERERLRSLAAVGVTRHTALAYAHREGMAAALNEHTLGLAEDEPALIPSFTFHPEDGVDEYVAAAIERGGEVAKAHLQVGRYRTTDPRLAGVWEQLTRHRIPVVLHAGAVYGVAGGEEYCGVEPVVSLLEQHPDLLLVIAHLGAPDYADFVALAEATPTMRMDTAMVLTGSDLIGWVPPGLEARLRALSGRILFGSDFPSIPHEYATQIRGLARLRLDRDQLAAVLHGNATAMLDGRDRS